MGQGRLGGFLEEVALSWALMGGDLGLAQNGDMQLGDGRRVLSLEGVAVVNHIAGSRCGRGGEASHSSAPIPFPHQVRLDPPAAEGPGGQL